MSIHIITICGISLLGVLCDLIMPEGSTKKYVRTVTGIVVTLVVVRCVFGLFGEVKSASAEISDNVQTDYITAQTDRAAKQNLQYVVDRLGLTETVTFSVDGATITFVYTRPIANDKQTAIKQAVAAIYGDGFVAKFVQSSF